MIADYESHSVPDLGVLHIIEWSPGCCVHSICSVTVYVELCYTCIHKKILLAEGIETCDVGCTDIRPLRMLHNPFFLPLLLESPTNSFHLNNYCKCWVTYHWGSSRYVVFMLIERIKHISCMALQSLDHDLTHSDFYWWVEDHHLCPTV
jgi:hypothetical protein